VINSKPTRRIFTEKDLLESMEVARLLTGLTMEEVCECAGIPDRYYNKVKMGLETEKKRDLRRRQQGRAKPTGQSSVRKPFKMHSSMAWMLEACGMALVVMPLEQAEQIVDPDPVTDLSRRYRERIAG